MGALCVNIINSTYTNCQNASDRPFNLGLSNCSIIERNCVLQKLILKTPFFYDKYTKGWLLCND